MKTMQHIANTNIQVEGKDPIRSGGRMLIHDI